MSISRKSAEIESNDLSMNKNIVADMEVDDNEEEAMNETSSKVFGDLKATESQRLQKYISGKSSMFLNLRQAKRREEVKAAHVMKDLTTKYGTRGKSAKKIFLQAFEEDLRKSFEKESCTCFGDNRKIQVNVENMSHFQNSGERPAAIVAQSTYIRHLMDIVQTEIQRTGCPPPNFDKESSLEAAKQKFIKQTIDNQPGSSLNIQDINHELIKEYMIVESEDRMLARLDIYKRAFSALILHFTAMRPILLDIKRNYDSVLALRDRQMMELRIIKKSIAYKEQSMDEYMANLRYEGCAELFELEKRSFVLIRHIDKQDAAIRTMTEILAKLEGSLSDEFELRRDSEEQKRMLVQEVNELRRKLQMGPRPEGVQGVMEEVVATDDPNEEEEILSTEDPLILRTALKICRKNLSEAQNRLTILEVEYNDVIPRREFEDLKLMMAGLENEHKSVLETYNVLSSQVQVLKDQIEKLVTERDELQEVTQSLRVKATPRPSWTKIGEYVEGGVPRWKAICEGKSSNVIVDKLVEELTGKKISGPPDYMSARGTEPKVPKFLRYDNRVRDRRLSRRDAALVIHDIWQVRAEHLELMRKYKEAKEEESSGGYSTAVQIPDEPPPMHPFSDYLANYFDERYHLQNLRMEWTYNLVDACQRMTIDRQLAQFLSIAFDKTDEAVYHFFRNEVVCLRNALLKRSADEKAPPGALQRSQFTEVLRETLPGKSEEDIQSLLKAASKQVGAHSDWSIMKYSTFFVMTDEGLVGEFLDEFSAQYEGDRMKYVYEILTDLLQDLGVSLQAAEREDDPAGDTNVTMIQFYNSTTSVDPLIPEDKLGNILAWVFAGVSTLPGLPSKGVALVQYIRSHNNTNSVLQDQEDQQPDENDDEDFERAMKLVTARDDVEDDDEPQLTVKQRQNLVKQMKETNLRTVVKRLKGGAFMRSGARYQATVQESNIAITSREEDVDVPTTADTDNKTPAAAADIPAEEVDAKP